MKKTDVIEFFGGVCLTAAALRASHSTVSMWPEKLSVAAADRVRGAAVRLGKRLPKHMRGRDER